MPHHLDLIFTLTGGLTAALVLGFLAHRLRISPLVGYLLAGVVVGPFTPGFVAHAAIAAELAEIGVILLMFGVGLHFRLKELVRVGRVAIPGALLQIVVATGLGVLVLRAAGFSTGAGVVYGLAISVASTVVLLRLLAENDLLQSDAAHIAVGWLLVEDLFTVLALVMLPILLGERASGRLVDGASAVGVAVLKIAVLVAFTLTVGQKTIPTLLRYVAKTQSRELFTLTILVLALGIASLSAEIFGASMALGAFIAGLVVGQSEWSSRAASDALPMRDAFAVLFFVAMGMLLDPRELLPNKGLIAATLALIVVAKPLSAFLVMIAFRRTAATSALVAVALGQIGEFSFMLAALGRDIGILPERAAQSLIAASILSIALNPLFLRVGPRATRWISRRFGAAPGRA